MSLHVICSVCNREVGYFAGINTETHKKANAAVGSLDDTSKVLVVGPIVGTRGVCFDESKIEPQVYVCTECMMKALPEVMSTLNKSAEEAVNKRCSNCGWSYNWEYTKHKKPRINPNSSGRCSYPVVPIERAVPYSRKGYSWHMSKSDPHVSPTHGENCGCWKPQEADNAKA